MNPYLLLGIIALNTTVSAAIVSFLVSLGVSLLAAISGMYLFCFIIMFMMIKSSKRLNDDCELVEQGGYITDQVNSETPVSNQLENVKENEIKAVA